MTETHNISIESPEETAEKTNIINMALRVVGSELNPNSKNEFECLQHTLRESARKVKNDLMFTDEVLKSQIVKQPVNKAAKELSESLAYYLDVFLNAPGFHISFTDFYARGVRKKAYEFDSVKKTLTKLEHPLRLVGAHFVAGNYFDIFEHFEKGKGQLKTVADLIEPLDELGVFSVIIEASTKATEEAKTTKKGFFVAVRDSSGMFIMIDPMNAERTGQPLSGCNDKVSRAFGFFKIPANTFNLAGL